MHALPNTLYEDHGCSATRLLVSSLKLKNTICEHATRRMDTPADLTETQRRKQELLRRKQEIETKKQVSMANVEDVGGMSNVCVCLV